MAETISPRSKLIEQRASWDECPDSKGKVGQDDQEISQTQGDQEVVEHIMHLPASLEYYF